MERDFSLVVNLCFYQLTAPNLPCIHYTSTVGRIRLHLRRPAIRKRSSGHNSPKSGCKVTVFLPNNIFFYAIFSCPPSAFRQNPTILSLFNINTPFFRPFSCLLSSFRRRCGCLIPISTDCRPPSPHIPATYLYIYTRARGTSGKQPHHFLVAKFATNAPLRHIHYKSLIHNRLYHIPLSCNLECTFVASGVHSKLK